MLYETPCSAVSHKPIIRRIHCCVLASDPHDGTKTARTDITAESALTWLERHLRVFAPDDALAANGPQAVSLSTVFLILRIFYDDRNQGTPTEERLRDWKSRNPKIALTQSPLTQRV
ncbi:hypothetical protein QCA50_017515 [Cerrena zonata]|uniref:Uncharacterized protein n=1 Tax=Cerrena zonata TaxID=2478898 RepID=A0AAW0FFV5_9APHY